MHDRLEGRECRRAACAPTDRRRGSRGARSAPITPRTPEIDFARADVPRHWMAGSAAATHLGNGVNLLFPAGERFFVRSVRHYVDRIADAELAADVRGFFGQEGRHAQAHERFFDVLRAQGYEIDRSILEPTNRIAYGFIERVSPPALRLAATAACEHFTAILAEDALAGGPLDFAHPALRDLLMWHAVEELEHKSVAFDVLAAVAPSYALRVLGMAVASTLLGTFWLRATRELLRQDGKTLAGGLRELRELRAKALANGHEGPKGIVRRVFVRGIREYLRPGFHPNDKDHGELVARALATLAERGIIDAEHAAVAA